MGRRASFGGDSSISNLGMTKLEALQAASLKTTSDPRGVGYVYPPASAVLAMGGASRNSRPTIKRSVSMATGRAGTAGLGFGLAPLAKPGILTRGSSGGNALHGVGGRRLASRSKSNDTDMSDANWAMCTPRRSTGSRKFKIRKDQADDVADDVSIDDGFPTCLAGADKFKRSNTSAARINRKGLSSSSHSISKKNIRRVKSQGGGSHHSPPSPKRRSTRRIKKRDSDRSVLSGKSLGDDVDDESDPETPTKRRSARRMHKRDSDRSLASGSGVSIASGVSLFSEDCDDEDDDQDETSTADEGIQEATEKLTARLKADERMNQSLAAEASRKRTASLGEETPNSTSSKRGPRNSNSRSQMPTIATSNSPKRSSSRTKLQGLETPRSRKKASVSPRPNTRRESDATITSSKNDVPAHVNIEVEAVPTKRDSAASGGSQKDVTPPIPAFRYDPNSWTCVCHSQIANCMKFCGMCQTPQHWSCDECHFDENPCLFNFCGGCAADKPADALAKNFRGGKIRGGPSSPVSSNTLPTVVVVDLDYDK